MRAALSLLVGAMALASTARADMEPPVIDHAPVTTGIYGESVTIAAKVTDENEVFPPTLSWRESGDRRWKVATMALAGGRYVAQLKVSGDLEYWLEAYDAFGNGPALNGSPNKPHRLAATVLAVVAQKSRRALRTFDALAVDAVLTGHRHESVVVCSTEVVPGAVRPYLLAQAGTATTLRGRRTERGRNSFLVLDVGSRFVRWARHSHDEDVGFVEDRAEIHPRPE